MKSKSTKIAIYILTGTIAFFLGMNCYKSIYRKGFKAGVKFTLYEIKQLSEQNTAADTIRGI